MKISLRTVSLRNFASTLSLLIVIITQSGCLDLSRGYRNEKQSVAPPNQIGPQLPPPPHGPQKYESQSAGNKQKGMVLRTDAGEPIQKEILANLKSENFAQIEKLAQQARQTKKRYPGGVWEIKIIGDSVGNIYTDEHLTDQMWIDHIETIKKWEAEFPESALAKSAIANSYAGWGWFARGSGYSNSVLPEDRAKLEERMALAKAKLKELWNLNEKCQHAYYVMLTYAHLYGDSEQDFDHVFKTAIKFEPNYHMYYDVALEDRLPRWGGKPGDIDKFLMGIPDMVKTDDSNYIFFFLLINFIDDYPNDSADVTNRIFNQHREIIWQRVKAGYADMSNKFGHYDKAKNNYAKLAFFLDQKEEALKLMNEIEKNNELDTSVWSAQEFKAFKASLTSPPPPQIPQSVIESRSR